MLEVYAPGENESETVEAVPVMGIRVQTAKNRLKSLVFLNINDLGEVAEWSKALPC